MRTLLFGWAFASLMISMPVQADDVPKTGNWASTTDYPIKALREGREGIVQFMVVVGADGRAKSCTVTVSSGHADLDHAACSNVMTRARFAPARDANGNPVEETWLSKMEFRIPN
ncbi:MAG: energy transducer TonB [Sphingorhabdus sp.]